MTAGRFRRLALVAVVALGIGLLPEVMLARQAPQAQPPAAAAQCAYTWLGKEAELEEYLKTAEVIDMKDIGVGVTKPGKGKLAPGGPFEFIAWKPIPPGRQGSYWESYKSEIAAYELSKLLGINMVPPTVEKKIKGQVGAAVMWVSPVQNFKEMGGPPKYPQVPAVKIGAWTRQLVRAKMFDNLIANIDPNLGNWLADPDWHLILIDHTRSFTGTKNLTHKMDNIDKEFWEKIEALDEAALTQAVGQWLDKGEIKAILDRRIEMKKQIDSLVKSKGDAVFIK